MKNVSIASFVFVTLIIAAFSCKKSSSSSSPSQNLIGTWKIDKEYIDANSNGVPDGSELVTDTTVVNSHVTYTFNSDGTLVIKYYSITVGTNTWALVNNNTYLKVTDSSGSSYNKILSLTGSSAEITDTTGSLTWIFLNKI